MRERDRDKVNYEYRHSETFLSKSALEKGIVS